jgi:hypothetical protein
MVNGPIIENTETPPAAEQAAVTTSVTAPSPAAAPAEPSPPISEPAAPAEPASSEAKPTLLERFSADAEKKAAEPEAPKVEGEAPKVASEAEKPASETPAAPEPVKLEPIDYKYAAPEGFEISDDRKGELTTALDAFRANPAEGAQALLDLHAKAMVEATEKIRGDQRETFNNTLQDWEKAVLADPIIGGAGHETAMQAIARARDFALSSVPTSDRAGFRADFEHFLRATGAGSHPAFLKFVHAFSELVDEPQGSHQPTGILPPKDQGKAPKGARRSESFYDHPRTADN